MVIIHNITNRILDINRWFHRICLRLLIISHKILLLMNNLTIIIIIGIINNHLTITITIIILGIIISMEGKISKVKTLTSTIIITIRISTTNSSHHNSLIEISSWMDLTDKVLSNHCSNSNSMVNIISTTTIWICIIIRIIMNNNNNNHITTNRGDKVSSNSNNRWEILSSDILKDL